MSNIKELKNNKIAFHPGYYIEEYLEVTGLSQRDFAMRLGTTPKNISLLLRGEQRLSLDMAFKLSRLLDTSVEFWVNLQNQYDFLIEEEKMEKEENKELEVLDILGYRYFRDNFGLKDLPRKKEEQVIELRKFLNVSSLLVLENVDMHVCYRGKAKESRESIIRANTMVQIANNMVLKEKNTPNFDKQKFESSIDDALLLTKDHRGFLELITKYFYESGVNLVALPNLPSSKINGATKKIANHVMLMINDRNHYSDSFWFTLMHEAGHIMSGKYGVSLEGEDSEEDAADKFAIEKLIPSEEYNEFIRKNSFSNNSIIEFAKKINRDPGIIVGRLQKENKVSYHNLEANRLKTRYSIVLE